MQMQISMFMICSYSDKRSGCVITYFRLKMYFFLFFLFLVLYSVMLNDVLRHTKVCSEIIVKILNLKTLG